MDKIFKYILLSLFHFNKNNAQPNDLRSDNEYLVDYVNPLMGTDSTFELSNGNTYPAIATLGYELLDSHDSKNG